ncbi:acetate--CoA ligase family protein [Sedimentitalea sp.]|uniref:acetate--CoA ligase family protein n=1 Tax=Sedimentitalea sp. TaxID=2048915 RepID=UPI003297E2FA
MSNVNSLDPFFKPKSIAVIGSSSDPKKPGGRAFRYLKEHYKGEVFAVNPRPFAAENVKVYPSISDVPAIPDLVVIAIPGEAAIEQLEACAEKGIKAAVIFSAGFGEVGGEGKVAQDRLSEIARESGIRLLGPNCLGFFNVEHGAYATFTAVVSHGVANPGDIAIVSQSGAIGSHLFSLFRDAGLGISNWVATGNECDIDVADCIEYLANDPSTKIIVGYLEGCKNGPKLIQSLLQAQKAGKPVVMLKAGSSDVGSSAAESHTGALVGSDQIFDVVFEYTGVFRAKSYEDLLDVVQACAGGVYPAGSGLGIATNSGGAGSLLADYAADAGLNVPALGDAAQASLKAILPIAGVRNPVDTTATVMTQPDMLATFLDTVLGEEEIHAGLLYLSMMGRETKLMEGVRTSISAVRRKYPNKPVAIVVALSPEDRRKFEDDGFLICEDPARAVNAIAALVRLGQAAKSVPKRPQLERVAPISSEASLEGELAALAHLQDAGIPVAETILSTSEDEAVAAAEKIGGPVVMKLASPDIPHKSDVGGVLLNISSASDIKAGFRELTRIGKENTESGRLEGVLISPMVGGGTEVILGTKNDPIFGPVVMFGLGGIFVETYGDVTFRLAPIDVSEALAMMSEIKAYPILAGARGRKPVDLTLIAKALSALSHFAVTNANKIDSIDVNPFLAMPEGGCAVDALIVPTTPTSSDEDAKTGNER